MEKSPQDNITRSGHFSNVSLRLFFRMSYPIPMWQFIIIILKSKEIPYICLFVLIEVNTSKLTSKIK